MFHLRFALPLLVTLSVALHAHDVSASCPPNSIDTIASFTLNAVSKANPKNSTQLVVVLRRFASSYVVSQLRIFIPFLPNMETLTN